MSRRSPSVSRHELAVRRQDPENRHGRTPTWSEENPNGRWRSFSYDELAQRDNVNLDIFWRRDESLEDAAKSPTQM